MSAMLDSRHLMSDDWRSCGTLGKRLRWARDFREYGSQGALAKALGVTRWTIMRYEDDDYPPPDDQVELLADLLKVRPAWLRYGSGPPYVLPAIEVFLQSSRGQELSPLTQEELRTWSHNFFRTLAPGDDEIGEAVLVIEILLTRARKRADGDRGV
jgi:DNA-binding XRE family transcriptional regulator